MIITQTVSDYVKSLNPKLFESDVSVLNEFLSHLSDYGFTSDMAVTKEMINSDMSKEGTFNYICKSEYYRWAIWDGNEQKTLYD